MTPRLLVSVPTPASLTERIIARIRTLELRAARTWAFLFRSGALASVIATTAALWYGTAVVLNSSFIEYVSLISTDTSMFVATWRDLFLTLLETFPVIETLAVFVATYFLVLTISHAARYGRIITQLQKTT